jgi:hypothetical protein
MCDVLLKKARLKYYFFEPYYILWHFCRQLTNLGGSKRAGLGWRLEIFPAGKICKLVNLVLELPQFLISVLRVTLEPVL